MDNSRNENNGNQSYSNYYSSSNGMGPSSKKRKSTITAAEMSSSSIELEVLQFENQKLKEYVKKLEAEKLQEYDDEKILELQDTVSKLQTINAELNTKNEQEKNQHKTEMDNKNAKIQKLENEEKKFEAKIIELTDEITSMKTIKSEIKDSVENERETCQTEIHTLKTEIKTLKDKNCLLVIKAQEAESKFLNYENKNKEIKKKYDETTVAKQILEKKCKTLEAKITKNKKEYQTTIDGLKTENQEQKNKIEILENNEREEIVLLDDASNCSKLDMSLLSCKSNIIMNVSKIVGTSSDGWKLYSTLNESEKPRLLTEKDMMDTCFKMNITDQFIVSGSGPNLHYIMRKINTCKLTKLHLNSQTLDLLDFIKLVSSKKVQICIISFCTVLKEQNKCEMDELLMHLPNVTEFKYHCYQLKENFSTIAKNLGKLDKFRNLQKFEISQYFDSLNFEELDSFIKKNNKDVSYIFKFTVNHKSGQSQIKSSHKKLLKALPIPYNIKVMLQQ